MTPPKPSSPRSDVAEPALRHRRRLGVDRRIDDVRRHEHRHARLGGARRTAASSTVAQPRSSASTRGSSRCESVAVSPWPGKCLPQPRTPADSSPRQNASACARGAARVGAERAIADDRIRGIGVHVEHRRVVDVEAERRHLERPWRGRPPRCTRGRRRAATRAIGGHTVSGALTRCTRPPSWSTLTTIGGPSGRRRRRAARASAPRSRRACRGCARTGSRPSTRPAAMRASSSAGAVLPSKPKRMSSPPRAVVGVRRVTSPSIPATCWPSDIDARPSSSRAPDARRRRGRTPWCRHRLGIGRVDLRRRPACSGTSTTSSCGPILPATAKPR